MNVKKGYLILSDGKAFEGVLCGYEGEASGALAVNISCCGYLRALTCTDNADKILIDAFPLSGAHAVTGEEIISESAAVGYVVREICDIKTDRSTGTLEEFLLKKKIPALCNVDTREIIRYIRKNRITGAAISKKAPGKDCSLKFPSKYTCPFSGKAPLFNGKGARKRAEEIKKIKKTLLIGSGPIVIGQAAEFDYAGTQACRVLKQEGIEVVLVNPNPATIMTDKILADRIYLEPLTLITIKRIIVKEKPDSLLAGLGGQTGLTLAMQLSKEGFLKKNNVRLLGTRAESICKAEDRRLFKATMNSIGQSTIPSDIAEDIETALKVAQNIGYPVIIRPAFTLAGSGSGVANNPEQMRALAKTGLTASPISQILVEKNIFGWKEIEFEAIRDRQGNAIAVCSMENIDPVGVHTGDSIVVAPALTLTDREYNMLREATLKIVDALGIIGGCNCQYALCPDKTQYAVIEVNPRVSRSSALASKATGYPIAKVTAKLALGYTLDEIKNEITGRTSAFFEPSLDYVVLKFPKWPFDKFFGANRSIGTQMKATGEVMSIAPSFEMALMKAVRGAEISLDSLEASSDKSIPVAKRLKNIDDKRLFTIYEALKSNIDEDEICDITRIDRLFIRKIKNLVCFEKSISGKEINNISYIKGKKLGYTDEALKRISGSALPASNKASYKTADSCSGRLDTVIPYFYSTYDEKCESREWKRSKKPVILVLGSGPIRIGQGIEFDYSCVHCVWTLKELGYEVVIINNNPETVSTDYNTADRLYFEPLCPEDVMNIIEVEKPVAVVVAFGGQTAIRLAKMLDEKGIKILGTSAEGIDIAEDRERFDKLLEKFGVSRPQGMGVMTKEQAFEAAVKLGYPVLLRPSYVIGGQNMIIARTSGDIDRYMDIILADKIENPVLVDKYMEGPELEVDVISDGKDVLIPGIMQHIERAGVHSGDSIAVYPPYNINDKMLQTLVDLSGRLALALGTKGLVNIQYLLYQNEPYVIEVNPRASRTVPYISKVSGVPMVELAAKVMVGKALKDLGYGTGLYKSPPYYAVKVPVFSFEKLVDVNSYLGPEMKSTGEVLGIGKTIKEALFKGLTSANISIRVPFSGERVGVFLSVDGNDLFEVVGVAKKFDELGFGLYATKETAKSISRLGINVTRVHGMRDVDGAFSYLEKGNISYIIYTGALEDSTLEDYIALHRRAVQLGIPCLTSLDTANALADIIGARYNESNTELININSMRSERARIKFTKMQGSGNDYIFIENLKNEIAFPEALCISLCDRHYGIGAAGIVLIENSDTADMKMRIFNTDGSEGQMAGNSIRCLGKYLYDNGLVRKEEMDIETASGIKHLKLYIGNARTTSVCVDMGKTSLKAADLPTTLEVEEVVDYPLTIDSHNYKITCVSVGNPHCVVFCGRVDDIDMEKIGPLFERAEVFPERINTEFVRIVNATTIKMRVYERGNGETLACGTGACAAVVAATRLGHCKKGEDITVKQKGGDLVVNYTDERVLLTGDAVRVFDGNIKY